MEIKGEVFLRVGLLLLKYIFSTGLLPRLPEILALLPVPEQSALEYLRTILYEMMTGQGFSLRGHKQSGKDFEVFSFSICHITFVICHY